MNLPFDPFEVLTRINSDAKKSDEEDVLIQSIDQPQSIEGAPSELKLDDLNRRTLELMNEEIDVKYPEDSVKSIMDTYSETKGKMVDLIQSTRESGRLSTPEQETQIQEYRTTLNNTKKDYIAQTQGLQAEDIDWQEGGKFYDRLQLHLGAPGQRVADKFRTKYPKGWMSPVKMTPEMGGGYHYLFKYDNDNPEEKIKILDEEGSSFADVADFAKEGIIFGAELAALKGVSLKSIPQMMQKTALGAAVGGLTAAGLEQMTPGAEPDDFLKAVDVGFKLSEGRIPFTDIPITHPGIDLGSIWKRTALDASIAGATAGAVRFGSAVAGPLGLTTGGILLRPDQLERMGQIHQGFKLGLTNMSKDKPKGWSLTQWMDYQLSPQYNLTPAQIAFNNPWLRAAESRATNIPGTFQANVIEQHRLAERQLQQLPELAGLATGTQDDFLNLQVRAYSGNRAAVESEISRLTSGTNYTEYGTALSKFYNTWLRQQEVKESTAWGAVRSNVGRERVRFDLAAPRQWYDQNTGTNVNWTPQRIVTNLRRGLEATAKPKYKRVKDPTTGRVTFEEIPAGDPGAAKPIQIQYDPVGKLDKLMLKYTRLDPKKVTFQDLHQLQRQAGELIRDIPDSHKSAQRLSRAFYGVLAHNLEHPVGSAPRYMTALANAKSTTALKMDMYDLQEFKALMGQNNPVKQAEYFARPENFAPNLTRDIQLYASNEEKDKIKNGVMNTILRSPDPMAAMDDWVRLNPTFFTGFVMNGNTTVMEQFTKAVANVAQLRNVGTAHIARETEMGAPIARNFLTQKTHQPEAIKQVIDDVGGLGSNQHTVLRQALYKEILDNTIMIAPEKAITAGNRVVNEQKLTSYINTLKSNGIWDSGILTKEDKTLLQAFGNKVQAINSIDNPSLMASLSVAGATGDHMVNVGAIPKLLLGNYLMARILTSPITGKMLVNTKGTTLWTGYNPIKLNLFLDAILQGTGSDKELTSWKDLRQEVEAYAGDLKQEGMSVDALDQAIQRAVTPTYESLVDPEIRERVHDINQIRVNPILLNKQTDYDPLFESAEQKYNLKPGVLKAMAWKESRFNPGAYNKKSGASGMMQIVPKWHPNVDPYNTAESISYAGMYLRQLLDRYDGDYRSALAAYNWGLGNLDKKGLKNMPKETKDYVGTILKTESESKTLEEMEEGIKRGAL